MARIPEKLKAWLPFTCPVVEDPRHRRTIARLRVAAYAALAAALLSAVIQFTVITVTNQRRAEKAQAAGELRKAEESIQKVHRGAIGRWRGHIRQFWDGKNIYRHPVRPGQTSWDPNEYAGAGEANLHPNMPFTVILLTPFACMSVPVMALSFSLLKMAAFLAAIWLLAGVVNHDGRRMPDWLIGLSLLWSLLFTVGDIQHGNTNILAMAAVVAHLWLFRKGRDLWAGAMLALAVCIKMTPAIFGLYWLYQRQWKLLAATVVAGVVLAVVVPLAALGPARYATLTGTWIDNLILPGTVEARPYPIHINQSLPAVAGRYFLAPGEPGGDIFWNSDDYPYYDDDPSYKASKPHAWITLASLSPQTVKTLVRVGQFAILGLLAWAIGWRRLPRDDGRRAIHYGMVVIAMLLLNQRTWDHHAGVLLVADLAIWQVIAFGRISRFARRVTFTLMIAAGLLEWLTANDLMRTLAWAAQRSEEGKDWADYVAAYGPTFWHFVLLLVASGILAIGMKKPDPPYAEVRQTLAD
jgi:hypothetical protein